ncbi:MAG: geranylgeranylglycerol-phosphate geranylgeranyltransferase [Bacteroidia bacterium]|nr:geranylgeranylglycerol-phosphate geranylgeranyltransferase [Bacteroidia bacterium]
MKRRLQNPLQDLYWLFWLSRPVNVLISILIYITCAWIASYHSFQFIQQYLFWAQGVVLILITASGYWINDIFDYKIDRINRPKRTIVSVHLSPKKVWTFYNLVCGLIIGISLQFPWKFQVLDGFALIALYAYAYVFKRKNAIGNLLISLLSALVVISAAMLAHFTKTLIWLAVFAFWTTLIREITKDVEDIPGDVSANLETLPIQLGIAGTVSVLKYAYVILLVLCNLPFILSHYDWQYLVLSLIFVQIPIIFVFRKLTKSVKNTDFSAQSRLLKWIMVSGLLSFIVHDIFFLIAN